MRKLIPRSAVLTAAFAPIAAAALMTPAVGTADPLNCQNGQWWDPGANICRAPISTVPLDCQNGEWWDPAANVCRPPIMPDCGAGQWWNPGANACRPLGQL